jgi:hypothetical protein
MLNSLATFEFWLATKRFRIDRHYKIERGYDDIVQVRILRGKFKGVSLTFHNIRLSDYGTVEFETVILENPENADVFSNKFVRVTNNILRALLREVSHETGTDHITESDEEREFYEENSPLLEKRILRRKSRPKDIRTDSEPHQ